MARSRFVGFGRPLRNHQFPINLSMKIHDFGSRVVIFDMSPLLGCDDTLAFLPKVDCALLVAASGDTRVEDLKEAKRILGKTNILGTVLNKAPAAFMPNQYY